MVLRFFDKLFTGDCRVGLRVKKTVLEVTHERFIIDKNSEKLDIM